MAESKLNRTNTPIGIFKKGLLSQCIDPKYPEVKMYVESLVQAAIFAARAVKQKDKATAHNADALDFIKTPRLHSAICESVGIEPEFYSKAAMRTVDAIVGK